MPPVFIILLHFALARTVSLCYNTRQNSSRPMTRRGEYHLFYWRFKLDLKEIKNIFVSSKYFSKILIEDDFEISGLINLWNENNDILMSGING